MRCTALLITFISMFFVCCKQKRGSSINAEPAFYHWKTNFAPSSYEMNLIKQDNVKTIYLRFFDVAWDATYRKPAPIAQVRIADSALIQKMGVHIIPTVFITNECIRNIEAEQCIQLAQHIFKLINNIAIANKIDSLTEIQIDCDWTATTREKYFSILTELQKMDSAHLYSATIRLFQVKYRTDAGVPPVKKGLLMCYNMGNLKREDTKNSILDVEDVKKYTANLNSYPLPLDVALPLFEWYVVFRKGSYAGLIQNITASDLKGVTIGREENRFEIVKDTLLKNIALRKGDLLRREDCSYAELIKTATVLKEKLLNKSPRLVLYHLDSITLSKYSAHEMEAIFRSLY